MEDTDDQSWAEIYCAFKGVRYLSHERYGNTLRIAVEARPERYEISVNVPSEHNASTSSVLNDDAGEV